jgi:hypothetical protein
MIEGWLELAVVRESKSQNALQYFEAVLKTNSRSIEAVFGKVRSKKYYNLKKNTVLEARLFEAGFYEAERFDSGRFVPGIKKSFPSDKFF